MIDHKARYRISTWDHEDQGWACYREGLSGREVMKAVRGLERWWDRDCSILVEREPVFTRRRAAAIRFDGVLSIQGSA